MILATLILSSSIIFQTGVTPSEEYIAQNKVITADAPYLTENLGINIVSETDTSDIAESVVTLSDSSSPETIQETMEEVEQDTLINVTSEYSNAAYIWNYFRNHGFSQAATAGIIGNCMTEVGGWIADYATMNLDVTNSNRTYYGMCQWSRRLYPQAIGMSLAQQCELLISTMPIEFRDFGRLSGYSYDSYIAIDSPEAAGLAFAKTYERCSKSSHKRRQKCARIAYDYFTTLENN